MHRSRASGASNLSRYGRFCARPLISYLMDFLNMRCGVHNNENMFSRMLELHLILWIRNPETLTRPLGFLIFTAAFKKFAWSPRALGQFLN